MKGLDSRTVRELMIAALPSSEDLALGRGKSVDHVVFLSPPQYKALEPDYMIVIGECGVGKTTLWLIMQQPEGRKLVSCLNRFAAIDEKTEVVVGFGKQSRPEQYPDRETLRHLLKSREPAKIWKTIIIHGLFPHIFPNAGWKEKVDWLISHTEDVALLLEEKDRRLEAEKRWAFVIFDALDCVANDWDTVSVVVRGLLQSAAELQATRRIRAKCFLRPDVAEMAYNAEKLGRAYSKHAIYLDYAWKTNFISCLVWSLMANAVGGGAFRNFISTRFGIDWESAQVGNRVVWMLPMSVRDDTDMHKRLIFDMGGRAPITPQSRHYSHPFRNIYHFLADGRGRIYPASFLVAVREAARNTAQEHQEYEHPLHQQSIMFGIQKAAAYRIAELKEEYPWIDSVMKPLEGTMSPCSPLTIRGMWAEQTVVERLWSESMNNTFLPPAHLPQGQNGISESLEKIGVLRWLSTLEVYEIPFVFRHCYSIGLVGGVKQLSDK